MRELVATQSILQNVLRRVETGKRITDVYLVIGDLSNIKDDLVRLHWDRIAEGTPAQGARLHFRRIPALFSCMVCRHLFAPAGKDVVCPQCGSRGVKIEHGEEFYVDAVEVDEDVTR